MAAGLREWSVGLALSGCVLAMPAMAQEFESLGHLDPIDYDAAVTAISGDGSTAVGYAGQIPNVPFRWTDAAGMEALTTGTGTEGGANAVNFDGSVIVGYIGPRSDNAFHQAVRWTETGIEYLGFLNPTYNKSMALGVSADGDTVVGKSHNATGNYGAFVWTSSTGMAELDLLADYEGGAAYAVAGDKIVGVSYDHDNFLHGLMYDLGTATLWDNGIAIKLPSLEEDMFDISLARAISADGLTIVGTSSNADGSVEAVRWVNGAVSGLGFHAGDGFLSEALDVSADGSVIVGYSQGLTGGETAFRWTDDEGMRAIGDILADAGIDHGFYRLRQATGVSDDGETIVGTGLLDNTGAVSSWIMRENAFTGVNEALQSLASVGQVGQAAQHFVGNILDIHQEYALQHAAGADVPVYEPPAYAADPGANFPNIRKRTVAPPRWRVFGYAEGYGGGDPGGGHGLGQIGVSYAPAPQTVIGASVGFGGAATDMAFDGRADLLGLSGAVFAAYVPDRGFQAILSATAAGMSADIERGYLNGTDLESSNGETDGVGYGAALRIGYAFDVTNATRLTPFATYQVTHVALEDYTETDGVWPAMIGDIEDTANIARLGLEARHLVTEASWLWASAAWVHRFEDETNGIGAELIGAFGLTGSTMPLDQDWMEATLGISAGFADGLSRISLSATAYIPGEGDVSGAGRIGLSRAF